MQCCKRPLSQPFLFTKTIRNCLLMVRVASVDFSFCGDVQYVRVFVIKSFTSFGFSQKSPVCGAFSDFWCYFLCSMYLSIWQKHHLLSTKQCFFGLILSLVTQCKQKNTWSIHYYDISSKIDDIWKICFCLQYSEWFILRKIKKKWIKLKH